MKLVSVQDISIKLSEDGVSIPRVKVCSEATEVINAIGRPYTAIVTVPVTIAIPTPGVIAKPEGAIDIVSAKDANGKTYALTTACSVIGEPLFDTIPMVDAGCIPANMYAMKDGSIIFHKELWGKEIELVYRTMPVGDDGWPMVAEAIVDAVVSRIEQRLVRSKMLGAALGNKPTNNMIVATHNEIKSDYHRMISKARAELANGNQSMEE